MYTNTKPLASDQLPNLSHLPEGFSPAHGLFLDIETTGLSPDTSFVYLIGCIYQQDNRWFLTQWYIEHSCEEFILLETVFTFAKQFHYLIHYNGKTFDLPYLFKKSAGYFLEHSLASMETFDLYRELKELPRLFPYSSLKQTQIEPVFGFQRTDPYSGKDLIRIYKKWQQSKDAVLLDSILLHNEADLLGMCRITNLFTVIHLLNEGWSYLEASKPSDFAYCLHGRFESPLPLALDFDTLFGHMSAKEDTFTLTLPLVHGKFRLFYANYREYRYLPQEDTAILNVLAKSSSLSQPATPETCYQWVSAKDPSQLSSKQGHQIIRHCLDFLLQ